MPGDIDLSQDALENMTRESLTDELTEKALAFYKAKEELLGESTMRELERVIMLQVVDTKWMDHIDEMDQLKQGIWLRSYGQKDPQIEYKMVGSDMFDEMIHNIKVDVGRYVLTAQIKDNTRKEVLTPTSEGRENIPGDEKPQKKQPVHVEKVGRNDPCPCGSGLKYKKCCGK